MEIDEKLRREAMEYVGEVLEKASKTYMEYSQLGAKGIIGDNEPAIARHAADGAIFYLTKKRGDLIAAFESPISKVWVDYFNCCEVWDNRN